MGVSNELRELVFLRIFIGFGLDGLLLKLKNTLEEKGNFGSNMVFGFVREALFLSLKQWTSPGSEDSKTITSCGLLGSKGPIRRDGSGGSLSLISSQSEAISSFEFKNSSLAE